MQVIELQVNLQNWVEVFLKIAKFQPFKAGYNLGL